MEEDLTEVLGEEGIEEDVSEERSNAVDNVELVCGEDFRLYDDGVWVCQVRINRYVNGYELNDKTFTITGKATDANGTCIPDVCTVTNSETSGLYDLNVDGKTLAEAGVTTAKVCAVLTTDSNIVLESATVTLNILKSTTERQFDFGDCDMLPGWEKYIASTYDCYVHNAQYPDGQTRSLYVTGVEAADVEGKKVVGVETTSYGGYILHALKKGVSEVTVTYTDWDFGSTDQETFHITVGSDVYDVDLRSQNGSYEVAMGQDLDLEAQASHYQIDQESGENQALSGEALANITYSWSYEIPDEDVAEAINNYIAGNSGGANAPIAIVPDEGEPGTAWLTLGAFPDQEDLPDDFPTGFDIVVTVSVRDGGEDIVAQKSCTIRAERFYCEVWPTNIDGDIEVGETITFKPSLRKYSFTGYTEYADDEVSFEFTNYNFDAYGYEQNDDGSFTVTRKNEVDTYFVIQATVISGDNSGDTFEREYRLNKLDYAIKIRDDLGTGDLFSDGTWSSPIEVKGFEDLDYELTVDLTGYEGGDIDNPSFYDALKAALSLNNDTATVSVDGNVLKSLQVTRMSFKVGAKVKGYQLNTYAEYSLDVREPLVERQFNFKDSTLMPGQTQRIAKKYNCHVENGDHPRGADIDLAVTDVSVSDETVVTVKDNGDDSWTLRAAGMGSCTVTVLYTDWDNTENQTEEFKINVESDSYDLDLWTESGSDYVLARTPVTLYAQASHEEYKDGGYHVFSEEEMSGITYNWSFATSEDASSRFKDNIQITQDSENPKKAVLTFEGMPVYIGWGEVTVTVSISEGGEKKAEKSRTIYMKADYEEVWPATIDDELDLFAETTIEPVIRTYPGTDGSEYDVRPGDEVKFEVENPDESALTITDNKDGTFTIKRLREYETSFTIRAFAENSLCQYEEVDSREYTLKKIDIDPLLTITDDYSIYTAPGCSYTVEEICEITSPVFTISTERSPEAKEYTVDTYTFSSVSDENALVLKTGQDGITTGVEVSENAMEGREGTQEISVTLRGYFGGIFAETEVKLLLHEHKWSDDGSDGWIVEKEATIYDEGFKWRKCSICSEVESAVIEQLTPMIEVDWTDATIAKSGSKTATVTYANGDSITSAVSSDTGVATVEINGKTVTVTAGTAGGTCEITVTLESGKSAVLTVTVPKASWYTATIDKTKSKAATITLASSDSITSAGTSDSNIATAEYSENIVTVTAGTTAGTATITVNLQSGISIPLTVEVPRIDCTEVTTSKDSYTVFTGETVSLDAQLNPVYSDNTLSCESADTEIATVTSEGLVKGIKVGTTTVTVTSSNNKTKTVTINVRQPVTEITLNKTSLTLNTGAEETLEATVAPANADDRTVTWESSDTDIVTVTSEGVVKAVAKGTATITATAKDGSGVKAECQVMVKQSVTEITLNKTSLTLNTGAEETLEATVAPANAVDRTVTWESSDTDVATVSSEGVVKAVAKGPATITVTANDGSGVKAECEVTVNEPVTEITLNKTELSLLKGKSATLEATVIPSDASNQEITWTSSDTNIATVSSEGVVTAVAKGTATITATAKDGSGVKAECKVTVKQPVTKIALNKTALVLNKGKSATLKATVTPSTANNKSVTWKSSNTKVVTVTQTGVMKAVAKGTATITVTAKDGSGKTATCKVTVRQPVTKIALNKTALVLNKGKSATLKATVTPSTANNKSVTWKSSNTKVATVTQTGAVKAVAKGTATITVTAKDGSGKTATCKVTVRNPVKEITLSYAALYISKGRSVTLKATVTPSTASSKEVTWKSSNTKVATVTQTGVVKAVGKGTAIITVTAKDGSGTKETCKIIVK